MEPDLSRLRIERQTETPRPRMQGAPFVVGAVVILLLGVGAFWFKALPDKAREEPAENAPAAAPLRSAAVEARTLSATGYVVAQRKAAVSSKATGRLKELTVVEGDAVKAGQVMGVLENEDLIALSRALEAEVGAAQAKVKSALAELEEVRLNFSRVRQLAAQKVSSRSEFEQAEARLLRAQADVEMARAGVSVAQAGLEKAKVDVEYTFIRAPFDGTVLTKNADIGEIVTSFGSSTNARAAIVTIADMSSLEVEADVSEANVSKVHLGQSCRIILDSFPGKVYAGAVSNIVPTVDRAKATVLAKIKFLSRDENVIPEMSAKVEFALQQVP